MKTGEDLNWSGRRVLITGVTGFVGTWLAKDLVERGADLIAFIRDEIPKMPLRWMGVYDGLFAAAKGDITDYKSVKRVFNEYEIDTCFHLAAQTIVGIAKDAPANTFDVNIRGSWNVFEAARTSEVFKRLVSR